MFSSLVEIAMVNVKLNRILEISWLLVLIPFYLFLSLLSLQIYHYISGLREAHPRFFRYLRLQLFFCYVLSIAGTVFMGMYVDQPPKDRNMLFIKMLPLYGVLLIVASVFIYLLPGLCDPENHTEKRIPFLMLSYLLMILAFMVLLCINEKILSDIDGYIIFLPLLSAFVFHMITIVPYFS